MSHRIHRSYAAFALGSLLLSLAGAQGADRTRRPPPAQRLGKPFEIVECSLGCVPGPAGFVCAETEIHVNETIRITFNQPVALASVSPNSFQVVDLSTGATPPAAFSLDPRDPSTLVWRPQLSFDSEGNPVFGLVDDHVYLLKLPGVLQDPLGPYVSSLDGAPNQIRLQCTVVASLGLEDAVPGRPSSKLTVVAVIERDPVTGEPLELATVPAAGAVDVWLQSPLEIGFGDLMNPATLLNPVTGQSHTIRVWLDPDGNLLDVSDQVPILGAFTLQIEQDRPATLVRFQPTGAWPPSGTTRRPARVVVELAPQIADLGGNPLADPGRTSFTTEAR